MTANFDDATNTDFNNITSSAPAADPYSNIFGVSRALTFAKTAGQEAEKNYRDTQQKVWIYRTRTTARIDLNAKSINQRALLTNLATSNLLAGVPEDNIGNLIRDEARSRTHLQLFEKTGQYLGWDVVKPLAIIPPIAVLTAPIWGPFYLYSTYFLEPRLDRESAKIGTDSKAEFLKDVAELKKEGNRPDEAKKMP